MTIRPASFLTVSGIAGAILDIAQPEKRLFDVRVTAEAGSVLRTFELKVPSTSAARAVRETAACLQAYDVGKDHRPPVRKVYLNVIGGTSMQAFSIWLAHSPNDDEAVKGAEEILDEFAPASNVVSLFPGRSAHEDEIDPEDIEGFTTRNAEEPAA